MKRINKLINHKWKFFSFCWLIEFCWRAEGGWPPKKGANPINLLFFSRSGRKKRMIDLLAAYRAVSWLLGAPFTLLLSSSAAWIPLIIPFIAVGEAKFIHFVVLCWMKNWEWCLVWLVFSSAERHGRPRPITAKANTTTNPPLSSSHPASAGTATTHFIRCWTVPLGLRQAKPANPQLLRNCGFALRRHVLL